MLKYKIIGIIMLVIMIIFVLYFPLKGE